MLTRLDARSFAELEAQWKAACEAFGESYEEYAAPSMEHARTISGEEPGEAKYGIFALKEGAEFVCILHANWARLPKTTGKTVLQRLTQANHCAYMIDSTPRAVLSWREEDYDYGN